ncbi:unnamed protein product [Adineta steineri]|uniref:Potassium channel tetramerisation-type BTB domain-containing protein n=1 Tax=Adineta steineri TaxID=433720 RepID=A0A815GJT6_9BILA|nr:unnamed protein product [Adineta steineri]CAF1339853.1 unnamed protein product [Adineta steineri]
MKRLISLFWYWSLLILPFTAIITFISTLIVCSLVLRDSTWSGQKYPNISVLGTGRGYIYFMSGFVILTPQFLLILIGRLQFLIQSQTIIHYVILYIIHSLGLIASVFLLIMAIRINGNDQLVERGRDMLNAHSINENTREETAREFREMQWNVNLKFHQFNQEKERARQIVSPNELIRLNIGGKIIITRRETLLKVPGSLLAKTFDGTHQNDLRRNPDGSYFLDYNPDLFSHLLDQLRMLKTNETILFSPPLSSTLVKPFNEMLKELGLPLPKQSPNDIISLNVGGERIVTLRKTLTSVPNSNLARLISSSKGTKYDQLGQPFLDYNPKLFQHLLDQLRQGKNLEDNDLNLPSNDAFQAMLSDLRKVEKSKKSRTNNNRKQKKKLNPSKTAKKN